MNHKLTDLISIISKSVYISRLRDRLWVPFFILVLQGMLTYHFLVQGEGFLAQNTVLSSVIIFAKCMFRATLWISLAWWLVALPQRKGLYRVLASLLLLLVVVVHLLESFLLNVYGMCFSHPVLLVLAGTNSQEAQEYWNSTFSLLPFLRPCIEIVVAGLLAFVVVRVTQKHSYATSSLRRSQVAVLGLYGLSLLLSLIILAVPTPRTYEWVMQFGTAFDQTISPFDRVVWNSIGFVHEKHKIEDAARKMHQLDLGNLQVKQKRDDTAIVIIIGETLRRDYLHCYGYPLSNTPHMDSLLATGDMIKYTDVISPAGNTIESLTKVLTMQQNESPKPWYEYPTLGLILSRAGYPVYWVSNQESTGALIQPLSIIASLSDKVSYANARSIDGDRSETSRYYDEGVLKDLHIQQPSDSSFVQFVHLEGSHPEYYRRFPDSFKRFSPKDLPVVLGDERDQIRADYVNSVYYNDYVIDEIIRRYSKGKALIFYFSDHGEVLYDDPNQPHYAGHAVHPAGLSIPFFVYLTPQLRKDEPLLYEQMQQCRDLRIMNDLFTPSLCDLLGIQTKYTQPENNFFSPTYNKQRRRIIKSLGKTLEM